MPKGQFTCPEEIKSKGVPPQGHQPLWGSDFPWSMWAMMEKFRILLWSVKKIHLRKMGNGQVILGCTPRRSPADRRRGQAPALQNRVMIGAPAGAPGLRALRIPAATALVFQGHGTDGGPAGAPGTAQPLSGPAGQSRCVPPEARRRRPKLRIVRFRAGPKAHSLRWASSPHRTRFAGLRRGPVTASASQWGGRRCAPGLCPVRTAHRRREPPFRGAPGEHPQPLLSPHFFGKKWGCPPRRRRRGRFR